MAKKNKQEVIDFMQYLLFPQDKWVFQLAQKELHTILNYQLRHFGYDKLEHMPDGYTYAPGEIPVMLVAHTDTVHHAAPEIILYDPASTYMWSPQGLGADDRAGVWGILGLLRAGFRPHILFTCDEETGCKGARKATEAFEAPPDVRYVIELDRRGSKDCVFYSCDSEKFSKYVESFGFKTAQGSCSDISTLCPKWEIAGVNLSAGYYEQHSKTEHLVVNELAATLRKVSGMLKNVPATTFVYEAKKYVGYSYNSRWYKDDADAYSRWYGHSYEEDNKVIVLYPDKCKKCLAYKHCSSKSSYLAKNCNVFKEIPAPGKNDTCIDKYRCPNKAIEYCASCNKWKDGNWTHNNYVNCEECSEYYFCNEAGMFKYTPTRRQCEYFHKQEGPRKNCITCGYKAHCYGGSYVPTETDYCPEWSETGKPEYEEEEVDDYMFEDVELPVVGFSAEFNGAADLEICITSDDLCAYASKGTASYWENAYFENLATIGNEIVCALDKVMDNIVKRLENPIDLKKVKA